jgi:replication fork protection complex subunit Tof1/Swi1
LHRQQAINQEAGSVMDMAKQQKSRKGTVVDELTTEDNLSIEARTILRGLAKTLLEGAFNRECRIDFWKL